MTQKPDNLPAFPHMQWHPNGTGNQVCGMTLLTYAAIHLKQPISERDDINAAILAAKRDELAAAALPSIILSLPITGDGDAQAASVAYTYADAMLKARESRHDD